MQTAVARQVSFVVHDLKNPLTAIRLQAELALRQLSESEEASATRNLQAILRAVEWMNDLVGDLLDSPVTPDEVEALPVPEFVLCAVEQLRFIAEARRVTFDISLAPDLPAVIASRRHALPILLNIVGNAIQHGPEGGTIHVSATAQGSQVVFSVRDEGLGLSRQISGRVFEAGVRGADSRGHGLGLAIASARSRSLAGKSGRSRRSRMAPSSTSACRRSPLTVVAKAPVYSHPLVVLVDENPSTLVELTRALMVIDVSLAWFTTTADALATVHREPPAIVICGPEVALDEADDFLARVAVRSPRTQRLLLLSGIAKPLRSGTAVLSWPADPHQLRSIVASATVIAFATAAAD